MRHDLYPLTFFPIYKETIWGGRQLARVLGRALPPGLIGESWDVAAHKNGTSVVDRGPLAGRNLAELVEDYGDELLGRAAVWGRFPLLLKLIDAHQDLSVQVHPDDEYVRALGVETWGKSELWYILHSEPGAWIIWGLRPGVTKDQFARDFRGRRSHSGLFEQSTRTPRPGFSHIRWTRACSGCGLYGGGDPAELGYHLPGLRLGPPRQERTGAGTAHRTGSGSYRLLTPSPGSRLSSRTLQSSFPIRGFGQTSRSNSGTGWVVPDPNPLGGKS